MTWGASKTGNGAFSIVVWEGGRTSVYLGPDSGLAKREAREFQTPLEAYNYYLPMAGTGNHGAWNICYHLEDVIGVCDIQQRERVIE